MTLPARDGGYSAPTARTTRAADGLARRRFTVAEAEAMAAAGILPEDERCELIGGEFVMMSPKGVHHEVLKIALVERWYLQKADDLLVIPATTFRLSADTYLEPDFVVVERMVGLSGLSGETALLVVEIGDSSLSFDLGRKAALYAGFGVRELWVIDAVRLETHRHLAPSLDGYRRVDRHDADATLVPEHVPGLTLRLADLPL